MGWKTYNPDKHRDYEHEKVIVKKEDDGTWTLRKANYHIIAEYGRKQNAMSCANHTGHEVVIES